MKSANVNASRRTGRARAAMVCGLIALVGPAHLEAHTEWNQWLGGTSRTLTLAVPPGDDPVLSFKVRWRVSLGGGFAGLSVFGTNAVTAMSAGKLDVALLLDPATGAER